MPLTTHFYYSNLLHYYYSFVNDGLKIAAVALIMNCAGLPEAICSVYCCGTTAHLNGNAAVKWAPSCVPCAFSSLCNYST